MEGSGEAALTEVRSMFPHLAPPLTTAADQEMAPAPLLGRRDRQEEAGETPEKFPRPAGKGQNPLPGKASTAEAPTPNNAPPPAATAAPSTPPKGKEEGRTNRGRTRQWTQEEWDSWTNWSTNNKELSNKELQREVEYLKENVRLLARISMRHEDELSQKRTETDFILTLEVAPPNATPEQEGLLEQLYKMTVEWKKLQEQGKVNNSLRLTLFIGLLMYYELKVQEATASADTVERLAQLGYIRQLDGNPVWNYLRWNYDKEELEPSDQPPLSDTELRSLLTVLKTSIGAPGVLIRFHSSRKLVEQHKTAVTVFLGIGMRDPQALICYRALQQLSYNASTQLVKMRLKPVRMERQPLVKVLQEKFPAPPTRTEEQRVTFLAKAQQQWRKGKGRGRGGQQETQKPSDQPVLRLALYNPHQLCYANSTLLTFLWLVLFERSQSVHLTGWPGPDEKLHQPPQPVSGSVAISRQQTQIEEFQKWWASGQGDAAVASHPLLSLVDGPILAAVISSGSAYHNCLGIEQLDKLLDQVEGSTRDVGALEPLKKALRSKGGTRNQARAVGSLLFSTAMNIFDDMLGKHGAAGRVSSVLEEPRDSSLDQASVDWVLDEVFDPPQQFISSESFPPEATAAVRSGPRPDSELLGSVACGSVVLATGTCGNYIQCNVAETLGRGRTGLGFVLRQLDGLPLFSPAPATQQTLDESFDPVKIFVCAPSFPKTSSAAVRTAPTPDSELVTTLPFGSEVQATARAGSYLQIRLTDSAAAEGGSRLAWVPRLLGDLVLFVEQQEVKPTDAERSPASLSTEAAICEQTTQISRFQQWWADGHGDAAAAAHSILSLVDRSVLQDVVSAGANYHTCLSADRLDGLQRMVDKSRRPGLEALRRALLTKGGAKSQARAVGTVLFKEALTIFSSPKRDAGDQPTEGMGDLPGAEVDKTPTDDNHREMILDEIYIPPKRFVCSDAFPKDATVAVRAAPTQQSEFLTCLPFGAEIIASGRCGEFLRFQLQEDHGCRHAYVPLVFQGLQLFVPQICGASVAPTEGSRVADLERRVAVQEQVIQGLQAELCSLRAHMSAIATAFGAFSPKL
ncbi:obr1 [Symbiodinium microadriaticum]|nr:obr1 [Symbiodinium microadriaticum]